MNNLRLNTFEDEYLKVNEKKLINATKSGHIKKISSIKNDKVKNSLLELTKFFKTKWKKY